MKLGMSIIVRGDGASPETFRRMAEKAEDTKLDALWASDHLIMPKMRVSRYPGRPDGQLPPDWRQTYYQPFSVLNYLAALTTRVRLGTSVLILPNRNPMEVAAQLAELDCLSEGRINFGVGVGWYQEETEALGYGFHDRGARTDDGLGIIKSLWTQITTSIDGPVYRFEDAEMGPKPVQRPHPPIYVGGNSRAALRRVARYGDVWHPFKVSPEQVAEDRKTLAGLLEENGRSARGFPIAPKVALTFQDRGPAEGQAPTEGRSADIVDAVRRFRDAGASEMCFDIMTETVEVALDTMERVAQELRPALE